LGDWGAALTAHPGNPSSFVIIGKSLLDASASVAVAGKPIKVALNIFFAFRTKLSFLSGSEVSFASAKAFTCPNKSALSSSFSSDSSSIAF
jgi:hypothetical protein